MKVQVLGVKETLETFALLPLSVQNMNMRKAMNAGAGVIRDAAVANAPEDTRLLKRSIKIKVRVPNASRNVAHHGKPAYGVIGAARRFVGVQTFRKSGKAGKFKIVRLKPTQRLATNVKRASRYSHLAERRTRFLSRAAASAGPAAQAKTVTKLREGLNQFVQTRRSRHTAAMGV